jgi:Uma2 family endonuclease
LLTAEEFEALLDDGKRYELIDGELREMAPTDRPRLSLPSG